MLKGVKIRNLEKHFDERGFFAEIARKDWEDYFEGEFPIQISLSVSYPGMIRAWHRHQRGQVDYLIVIRGAMKIVVYDDESDSPTRGQKEEIIVNSEKLQIVRIPGYYWHGTKTIGVEPSFTIYAVSRLYDYNNPDEDRRPWNDPTIIDPKTKKPYDWNRPPHK